MPSSSKRRKVAIGAFKMALAAAIVGYLVAKIQADEGFARLVSEQKHWRYLIEAQLLVLAAFAMNYVRWWLLARGVDLKFSIRDAFRLGSLGFLLSQVLPGSVGGDLVKAVFIAREQPLRRVEAVATVFIDRVVGLCAMLVIASLGLLLARKTLEANAAFRSLQLFIWAATAVGIGGTLLMISPWVSGKKTQVMVSRIPLAGHTLTKIVNSLDVFRSRKQYLLIAFLLSLGAHSLFILAFWFITQGLPIRAPDFMQTASIVPLGFVAGAVPLTPGGLGLLESGVAQLFHMIGFDASEGAMVALAYRAMTYVVAAIGACYYVSARRTVDELLDEAEHLEEEVD